MPGTEQAVDWREEFVGMDERVFLDCANQGPFPRATIRAVEQALELKKYPERLTAEHYFELPQQARTGLAKLIGAEPGEIALTNGASDGINAVANGLEWKAGDEIVLPAREFPANYFPWKHLEERGVRVREVEPADGRFVAADDLVAALTEKTRLVAASYVGYADSNRIDLARVGQACRARGIPLVVDASQAVGAHDRARFDLRLTLFTEDFGNNTLGQLATFGIIDQLDNDLVAFFGVLGTRITDDNRIVQESAVHLNEVEVAAFEHVADILPVGALEDFDDPTDVGRTR
ncbi:MAG: aminotransferase class V-fold PLP-dependent enzyme [Acidobacteria bacterium]|nr:aminotransferase class V-fold PLP-dependent enzyme [Acidobacteriota bacterium]